MKPNLERDMKDAPWFVAKVRDSEIYAQHLYAAMCNNAFQKLELLTVLKDEVWSCSWRYAGSIVADIRCQGDYMDWYCSGIRDTGVYYDDSITIELSADQLENLHIISNFVNESVITDEIRSDLKQLGWIVAEGYYNDGL
jgi:hypothetical protein